MNKNKYFAFVFLVLVTLILGCNNKYSNKSIEKLAKSVVQSLIDNDVNSFKLSLLPQKNTMIEIMKIMEDSGKIEKGYLEKKAEKRGMSIELLMEEGMKRKQGKTSKSWFSIRNKAELKGVDWSSARYEQVEYKSKKSYEDTINKSLDMTKEGDIYIIFSSNNIYYEMFIDDVISLNDNWYIFDRIRWIKKLK
jgi:hypothetical protein